MKRDEFDKEFDNEDAEWEGDNAFQGLKIIEKYMPGKELICGAGHDVIWSVGVDELIEAGITVEDVRALAKLNWMTEHGEYLACFV